MLLTPCPLDVQKFTVLGELKQMSAEASTLGFKAGQVPAGQLYDDAADVGITLCTGYPSRRSHWYQTDSLVDGGGDVVAWRYRPTVETVRRHPRTAGWEVLIYND